MARNYDDVLPTIGLSDDQQQEALVHLIENEDFFDRISPHVTHRQFTDVKVQALVRAVELFRKEYGRHPTVAEVKGHRSIRERDTVTREKLLATLQEAFDTKGKVGLDAIKLNLEAWIKVRKIMEAVYDFGESYNKSERDVKKMRDASDALFEKIDDAKLVQVKESTIKWYTLGEDMQLEYERRKADSGRILQYGVKFLDDALGGIAPTELILIGALTGAGKCLGLGTPVLKYDGSVVPVESVKAGDLLMGPMGPDSLPRKVSGVTRGIGRLYKIIPDRGKPWVCNDVHVLTLLDTVTMEVIDIPLNEYMAQPLSQCMTQRLIRVESGYGKSTAHKFTVEDIGIGKYAGFQVDQDGRFLLGDFTVTHNSQLVTCIAKNVAKAGKRVHFFVLEAERSEIARRIRFSKVASMFFKDRALGKQPKDAYLSFGKFRQFKAEDLVSMYYDASLDDIEDYKDNLNLFYRDSGEFDVRDLEREVIAIAKKTDLIIIDHIHYVDVEGVNENAEYKKVIKTLRDIALTHEVPIIVVSHLRKLEQGKKASLVPSIADFHGTSDLTKVSTTCIVLGSAYRYGPVKDQPSIKRTYMSVLKSRADGNMPWIVAMGYFDANNNTYQDIYSLGTASFDKESEWEVLEEGQEPEWGKGMLIVLPRPNEGADNE